VAVRADVSDPADGERMVAAALAAFGRLNGAVNCAGISSKLAVPLAQTPPETWRSIMSVNLDGVFYSLRAELPAIAAAGGGSIVNIASILGIVGSSRSAAWPPPRRSARSSSSCSLAPRRSSPAPCTPPTAATPRADLYPWPDVPTVAKLYIMPNMPE
jgi:NAD(P)-dependent dehydrogenase (short-subunit alcohol dehydrogenase family)